MTSEFAHNLIKGKIAETIFELMFREANEFSVFRNGFEYAEEYLAQYRSRLKFTEVLDSFTGAPDFLLVKDDRTSAYLVEVKYRSHLDENELISIAKKIVERWDHSYLFIISKHGFHFSPANDIINADGRIEALDTSWIPQGIQEKYLDLARDYLWEHKHDTQGAPYQAA